MKLCIDCKHYHKANHGAECHRRLILNIISPIDGSVSKAKGISTCEGERGLDRVRAPILPDFDWCNPEGKFWEPA